MKLPNFSLMNDIWDTKADAVTKGDMLREVSPLTEKTFIDENGFNHYVFNIKVCPNSQFHALSKGSRYILV